MKSGTAVLFSEIYSCRVCICSVGALLLCESAREKLADHLKQKRLLSIVAHEEVRAISFKKDIVLFEHLVPEHCLKFSVRAFYNLAMPEISIVLRSMSTKSGLQACAIQLLLFYNVVQFRLWD